MVLSRSAWMWPMENSLGFVGKTKSVLPNRPLQKRWISGLQELFFLRPKICMMTSFHDLVRSHKQIQYYYRSNDLKNSIIKCVGGYLGLIYFFPGGSKPCRSIEQSEVCKKNAEILLTVKAYNSRCITECIANATITYGHFFQRQPHHAHLYHSIF